MDDNESRIMDLKDIRIRAGVISKVLKLLLPKNNKIFGESVPHRSKTIL
jgi:hypothetical protein